MKSAVKYLRELKFNQKVDITSIRRVNEILAPLNSIGKLKKITINDF